MAFGLSRTLSTCISSPSPGPHAGWRPGSAHRRASRRLPPLLPQPCRSPAACLARRPSSPIHRIRSAGRAPAAGERWGGSERVGLCTQAFLRFRTPLDCATTAPKHCKPSGAAVGGRLKLGSFAGPAQRLSKRKLVVKSDRSVATQPQGRLAAAVTGACCGTAAAAAARRFDVVPALCRAQIVTATNTKVGDSLQGHGKWPVAGQA